MSKQTRDNLAATSARATEALRERLARQEEIEAALAALVGALIDAAEDARPELIARHAALTAEQGALLAEMAELKARRATAERMDAEDALADAEAKKQEAHTAAVTAKRAMEAAMEALRLWRSTDGGGPLTATGAERRRELENAVTDTRIASVMAEERRKAARRAKDKAQEALAALGE
jgi:hypothetical protein